jgi:hypothetical protein
VPGYMLKTRLTPARVRSEKEGEDGRGLTGGGRLSEKEGSGARPSAVG